MSDTIRIKGQKVTTDIVQYSFIVHQMRTTGCSYVTAELAFKEWLREAESDASSKARSDAAWAADNARLKAEENRHNNWENMGW